MMSSDAKPKKSLVLNAFVMMGKSDSVWNCVHRLIPPLS